MNQEIRVWDTDAVIGAMKQQKRSRGFITAFVMGTIAVTAATVLELAVWAEEDKAIAAFYDSLHSQGKVIVPKRRDFHRAGRWLRSLRTTGTPEERRYQRMKLTMDSLTAATAWGMGFTVVTKNTRDFDRLAAQARGMLPAGQLIPGHVKPEEA